MKDFLSRAAWFVAGVALLGGIGRVAADGFVSYKNITVKGKLCVDSDAGANVCVQEHEIDRASSSNQTFNIRNSGSGTMELQVDGVAVVSSPGGVPSLTTGYAGHYERTGAPDGGGRINLDQEYFQILKPAFRYVDFTNGDDFRCSGKSAATASGADGGFGAYAACAWKSEQRALDDLPAGWIANVFHLHAAGTITGTQQWVLHSQPGNASTVPTVRVLGDCTARQATFSSTGSGAAYVDSSGVTKFAQVTSTPTVVSGSVPGLIADADFWYLSQNPDAGNTPTVQVVLSSGDGGVTRVTTSTSAVTTSAPRLCPWASIVSGGLTITSTVGLSSQGSTNLTVTGFKLTSLSSVNYASLTGNYVTQGAVLTGRNASFLNNFINTGSNGVFVDGYAPASTITGTVFQSGTLSINGLFGAISGSVFKGSSTVKLAIGGGYATGGQFFGGAFVKSLSTSDFENTGTAIRLFHTALSSALYYPSTTPPAICSAGNSLSFSGVGAPLILEDQSVYNVCGKHSGFGTLPSQVRSGSQFHMMSMDGGYVVTNSVDGGIFIIGQLDGGAKNLGAISQSTGSTDPMELARVSKGTY